MPLVDESNVASKERSDLTLDLQAQRDRKTGILRISAHSFASKLAELESYLFFDLVRSGTKHPVQVSELSGDLTQTAKGPTISLGIAHAVFARFEIIEPFGKRSIPVLLDSVAFELAVAVDESFSHEHVNTYTRMCLTQMLCMQICEAYSARNRPDNRHRTGFDHWQKQMLDSALSDRGRHAWSLEVFAQMCGLSVCHFARMFKVSYGLPFHQFVVQSRITHACSLLSKGRESISQIALACGFSDQSSFTRRFTATTGASPAVWRKSVPAPTISAHPLDS